MALVGQDNERKRLAKELHDGVGQEMLVVVSRLKRLTRKLSTSESGKDLDTLVGTTSNVLESLRRISRDMHPASIDYLGFVGTIQATIDQMNSMNIVEFICKQHIEDVDIKQDAQLHIIRIIQECFSNVIKHASASTCTLHLKTKRGHLCLRIDDDGIGIESPEDKVDQFGLGLISLDERIKHLNGMWRMETSPSGGLSSIIEIPLKDILENKDQKDA